MTLDDGYPTNAETFADLVSALRDFGALKPDTEPTQPSPGGFVMPMLK